MDLALAIASANSDISGGTTCVFYGRIGPDHGSKMVALIGWFAHLRYMAFGSE
jgi:hypothetical protein